MRKSTWSTLVALLLAVGLSAPLDVVSKHFGFTPERVVAAAKMALGL